MKYNPIKTNIYGYKAVSAYLQAVIEQKAQTGLRAAMAKFLRCHPTHISQVVKGSSHLSIEHAFELNHFLEHDREEATYFLLLAQKENAATTKLKKHFDQQLQEILKKRSDVSQVIDEAKVDSANAWLYYSNWRYAAIHIALTIPAARAAEALAELLSIEIKQVRQILKELMNLGLVRAHENDFLPTERALHLKKTDPAIALHHQNWRLKAAEHLQKDALTGTHYSGIASFSKEDVEKFRAELADVVKNFVETAKSSPSEELMIFNLDFFKP